MMGWEEEIANIARQDQQRAGTREFAMILRRYYDGLIAAGFSASDALHLTMGYQASIAAGVIQREINRDNTPG